MKSERDQIKIKINGKDKHYQDNKQQVNREEIAAGVNKEEEFEWVLPDYNHKPPVYYDTVREEDNYYTPRVASPYNKKKRKIGNRKLPNRNKPQFKMMIPKGVIISLISAIVVGVGLGFTVLMIFTDDHKSEAPTANTTPVDSPTKQESPKAKETASFGLDFSIVQGGVYSTSENASTAAETLKQLDIPAVVDETGDQFYVLIGIAENTQVAEQIEGGYKANNVEDAYAKPWSYKIENVALPVGLDKDWLIKGEELLKQLISLSGQAYANSLGNDEIQKLADDFQTWNKNKPEKAPKEIATQLEKYVNSLQGSIQSLSEGGKLETQQKTLNTYIAYKNILSELTK